MSDTDVAVIGMACRFPGAENVAAFWRNLCAGVESISFFREEELEIRDPALVSHPGFVNAGAVLPDIDRFDASFFGYSPREAELMDPQHRLFLECAWEALESAGYNPDTLQAVVGLYAGSGLDTYLFSQVAPGHPFPGNFLISAEDMEARLGNGKEFMPARVSYKLNLRGPSIDVQTACSTSLVAVHLACQGLIGGECDMAMAGAATIAVPQRTGYLYRENMIYSPDGHTRAFDAEARGTLHGSGVGVVVLKPYRQAVEDGDTVHAIIKGSAVNNDGGQKIGFAAPGIEGQAAVISEALAVAGVDAATLTYVEAHGTGTALGDPIEIAALTQAFRRTTSRVGYCAIGSVKTNFGHLAESAGVASLIKTVLALEHRRLPPSLHFRRPNPDIAFAASPFRVQTELSDWQPGEMPRRAGVSSFGMGGTNCHVVLEEAPRPAPRRPHPERTRHLLALSARSATALAESAARYAAHLRDHQDESLPDLCFTANAGRRQLEHRLALVSDSVSDLRGQLEALEGSIAESPEEAAGRGERGRDLVFLFAGQGAQYPGMGRLLYDTQPRYRDAIDRCADILQGRLPRPLQQILFPPAGAAAVLDETAVTQPALFAQEYALFELWSSWGIEPAVVLGHSVGEYVAASVAGAFGLEDGLALVAERGRLMGSLPSGGGMMAVSAAEERVLPVVRSAEEGVSIAAVNGPASVVLAGPEDSLCRLRDTFSELGVRTRALPVSHAFHSPQMEPILDALERAADQASPRPLEIPLVSNLTGEICAPGRVLDGAYWRRHARRTVAFAAGIDHLAEAGYRRFVDLGPEPVLARMGRACRPDLPALWLPSLTEGEDDWQVMLTSLASLYRHGVEVDWLGFDREYPRRRIPLPTYPFQRKSYWITRGAAPVREIRARADVPDRPAATPADEPPEIAEELRAIVANILHMAPEELSAAASFSELGADSIVLAELGLAIEREYGVALTLRRFFEDLPSLDALAGHLAERLPAGRARPVERAEPLSPREPAPPPRPQGSPPEPGDAGAVERILSRQLEAMSRLLADQLEVLRSGSAGGAPRPAARERGAGASPSPAAAGASPFGQATGMDAKPLSPGQRRHLDELIAGFNARTSGSKQHAERYRPAWADLRSFLGMRPELKEMRYPIVGRRGRGSRFWDLDGNEYVDITMGMGVLMFGHDPPFVQQALAEGIERGLRIGPRSEMAGEVAELVRELTGLERVAFGVSGTDAVMIALRLARAVTGRSRIAMFSGAYHGHFDETLGVAKIVDGELTTIPMIVGVAPHAVENVLILPYGSDSSLRTLRQHAPELAAVLVEPVQSRNPNVQPREFLHALRQITRDAGAALIFDEIVTGFRIHQGGAQAHFGVEADLATYGKLIGGGMPIGIVAGKAVYLDRIDGGPWRYGDDSMPEVEQTFVAGTFGKHPLSMIAARAVLRHLQQQGPQLQEELNRTTAAFTRRLDALFERRGVPIKMVRFGSLFRFAWLSNLSYLYQPLEMEVFFHHLVKKGIYVWEGRLCFLSTAHTGDDLETVFRAVEETLDEMRAGDFLPAASRATVPLSEANRQLLLLAGSDPDRLAHHDASVVLRLRGALSISLLAGAVQQLIARHEATRRVFRDGSMETLPETKVELVATDLRSLPGAGPDGTAGILLEGLSRRPFDLAEGPLYRFHLFLLGGGRSLLVLSFHHLVVDGLSMGILLRELAALHGAAVRGLPCALPACTSPAGLPERSSEETPEQEAGAREYFAQLSPPELLPRLPRDHPEPASRRYRGARSTVRLDRELLRHLEELGRRQRCTLFMVLLAAYAVLLHRLSGQDELRIAVPTSGRSRALASGAVGNFHHYLPVRSRRAGEASFAQLLQSIKRRLLDAHEHPAGASARLFNEWLAGESGDAVSAAGVAFNLDRFALPDMNGLVVEEIRPLPIPCTTFQLNLNVAEIDGVLICDLEYDRDLFAAATAERWLRAYESLLKHVVAHPEKPVAALEGELEPRVGQARGEGA